MTALHRSTLRMPAAGLGGLNPLPPLVRSDDPHDDKPVDVDDAAMLAGVAYGRLDNLLPYLVQDSYDRHREERDLDAVILENEVLRATFLPGLGGRLWSLVHLPTGRELLYRNRVLQPANLALRNAWFAGGVEWNLGTTGHTTLTCEPLHTVRVRGGDGTPVLRMYEYERTRELVYVLDFSLPPGSPVLLVAVRVINPTSHEVPLYWWSNTAVPEGPDVRVVVPADSAYHYSYDRGLHVVPVPHHEGRDLSYAASAPHPADWFFDCRAARRPWISALDGNGEGLFQVSTPRLVGRKLFVWGSSPGGSRWQEFLSEGDDRYIEIQAGLARTQLEHEPLAAGTTCEWVEAYGMAAVDRADAHADWETARAAAEASIDRLAPPVLLADALVEARARADLPVEEVLLPGSGWGALEVRRRGIAGEPALTGPGTPWPDDTLGPEQEPWLELLRTGRIPHADPGQPPPSYVVGRGWLPLIEAATDDWVAWLHRGVARWHSGAHDEARAATEASVEHRPTPWGLRNLAVMQRAAGDLPAAVDSYRRALARAPGLRPLVLEAMDALVATGAADDAIELLDSLDAGDRAHGRVRLLELKAALRAGDLDRAERILGSDLVVDDLREGEDSLATLWQDYHLARGTNPPPPLPRQLDFRMG